MEVIDIDELPLKLDEDLLEKQGCDKSSIRSMDENFAILAHLGQDHDFFDKTTG